MRIYNEKDYNGVSRKAANLIAAQLLIKPESVLGLATGSSPVGTYEYLVKKYEQGDVDFSKAVSVNLDEYKGLPQENEQSYFYFMQQHLFSHVNLKAAYLPNGLEPDSAREARRYEDLLRSLGGVDLQLLGIGHNGHIGFNEPGSIFEKETHCVDLQTSTIEANKRFFNSVDEVPRQAYTMGIGTIMRAGKILLIVSGEEKSEILREAFLGPVTPQVPASILQFHPDVTLIGDTAALSKLLER